MRLSTDMATDLLSLCRELRQKPGTRRRSHRCCVSLSGCIGASRISEVKLVYLASCFRSPWRVAGAGARLLRSAASPISRNCEAHNRGNNSSRTVSFNLVTTIGKYPFIELKRTQRQSSVCTAYGTIYGTDEAHSTFKHPLLNLSSSRRTCHQVRALHSGEL